MSGLRGLKQALAKVMTDSQDFWPGKFRHYGDALRTHGLAPAPEHSGSIFRGEPSGG